MAGYQPGKVERTRAALGEAVLALLAESPDGRMTADDIAVRAGMGRTTWFRNCSGKGDAVASALVARWAGWAEAEGVEFTQGSGLTPFLSYVYSQRGTISLLYERGLSSAVHEASGRIAALLGESGVELGYRGKFYLYGIIGIIDEWVARGFADSPKEVAALVTWTAGPLPAST